MPPARPRIGLAPGSGSACGTAHIGLLRAMAEAHIEVDVVPCTSIGAIIGAVSAASKLDGLASRLLNLDWQGIIKGSVQIVYVNEKRPAPTTTLLLHLRRLP